MKTLAEQGLQVLDEWCGARREPVGNVRSVKVTYPLTIVSGLCFDRS